MSPSIGRIVIFKLPDTAEPVNGSREHPAIVVSVHSETMVNLRVFFDWNPNPGEFGQYTRDQDFLSEWQTSVPRADGVFESYDGPTWRWPERT